jgi:hypothetical protein
MAMLKGLVSTKENSPQERKGTDRKVSFLIKPLILAWNSQTNKSFLPEENFPEWRSAQRLI